MGMLAPLRLGLALIMPQSLIGKQIVCALQEGQVTVMIGVPRLYRALFTAIAAQTTSRGHLTAALLLGIRHLSTTLRRRWGLRLGKLLLRPLHQRFGPQLRLLASGGAALDPELAWQLEGLGWRIAAGYGLTETAPLLSINRPGAAKIESAGRPIPGVELRIDPSALPDALKEQAQHPDEASHPQGEILARGPSVFSGYHNLPEQTKEVFTADGWFRTGDFGTFDNDGYLYVLGRVSTLMVTPSGENIQPEDVEDAYLASSSIREIGVLQQDDQLVAVIVPELSKFRQHSEDIAQAIRTAVAEQSKHIPSYQRVTDYVITCHPLPRTHLGKIRRHLLPDLYTQARKEGQTPHDHAAGPLALHEMAAEDQALLQTPAAKRVWDWLASHYADRPLSPDTSPQLDLGIDSLEWLNLTLAVSQHIGIEINEQMISRIETVRDLLREVAEHTEAGATPRHASPLEEPEAVLNDQQKRWLKPLGPVLTGMAWGLYILNRLVMRGLFRLRLQGYEHLANQDQIVLTPNHISYLDPFAIAAALSFHRLRQTYWGGWTGVAFSNPISRFVSRLAQAVPIDAEQATISSLAFGAAVLKRKKSLVWFPEGHRSASGELQPFQPGIGMLLHHFPVPVVPVYLHGPYEAMPPGAVLPRPRRITVVIGKPLNPPDLAQQGQGDAPHERLVHVLHHHVAELGR
jgi:long-chain acyl-CoA synthetase